MRHENNGLRIALKTNMIIKGDKAGVSAPSSQRAGASVGAAFASHDGERSHSQELKAVRATMQQERAHSCDGTKSTGSRKQRNARLARLQCATHKFRRQSTADS